VSRFAGAHELQQRVLQAETARERLDLVTQTLEQAAKQLAARRAVQGVFSTAVQADEDELGSDTGTEEGGEPPARLEVGSDTGAEEGGEATSASASWGESGDEAQSGSEGGGLAGGVAGRSETRDEGEGSSGADSDAQASSSEGATDGEQQGPEGRQRGSA
jgi:hypothetical protein